MAQERYYLDIIQHNKEKDAENRTQTKGFDTLFDAQREMYRQLGVDMGNETLDWGVAIIYDKESNRIDGKGWERDYPTPEVETTEETEE